MLLNAFFCTVVRATGVLVLAEGLACSTDFFANNPFKILFLRARTVLERHERQRRGLFLANVYGKLEIYRWIIRLQRPMQNQSVAKGSAREYF